VTKSSSAAGARSGAPGVVSCGDAINGYDQPGGDYSVVLGAVAVPSPRALQAAATDVPGIGSVLFAKYGLVVKRGVRVELRVPESVSDRFWIAWGSSASPGSMALVDRCTSEWEWIAFAGGYWARQPGCFPLQISVNGGPAEEVFIGVGASCPGQASPGRAPD
jgi:hypothetical protein